MIRRLFASTLLAVGLLGAAAVAPPAAAAAVPRWTVSRITSVTVGFDDVSASPGLVAMRTTDGSSQVWAWSPGHLAAPLPGAVNADSIAVSGNRAVWMQRVAGFWQVFTRKVGDSASLPVTSGSQQNSYPAVSGDRLAWVKSLATGSIQVVTKTMTQSAPTTISAVDSGPKFDARVSGDRVVWNGSDGHTWQIYSWATGDRVASQITTDSLPHINPQVSGNRLVWMAQDESGDGSVCTWKKGSPDITRLGPGPYEGFPQVSGDYVVWTSGAPGETQVSLWQPGHMPRQLTAGPHWASSLHISGDRLVWEDEVGGQWEIVTQRVGESSPTTLAISVEALDEPVVGGDRVAWGGLVGGSYHVFTAAPVPIATSLTRPTTSPATPTHGRTATFRAYLSPAAAAFAYGATATLYLYRRESGHWRLRNTVTMKRTTASGGRALLSAGVKPRYAGKWRAIVKFGGTLSYTARTSSARDFMVR
jgi:hypothetical protein